MENNKQNQQDTGKLSIYERVRSVPKEAKKEIEAGSSTMASGTYTESFSGIKSPTGV